MQSVASDPGPYRTVISPIRIPPPSEPGTGEEAERILLLAPTGRDAELMARILGEAGFTTAICSDVPHLCAELQRGGGAAVAAEEALGRSGSAHLKAALATQPSWSDLPLTILLGASATPESSQRLLADLGQHGNLTLLGRPVRTITLVSTLQAAIRARCRQYDVRDHLAERAQAQAALERSEARYRSLTLASVSIVWIATDTGDFVAELPSWQAYTGQSRASYEGWGWLEAVHPEDRERVAATWREALALMAVYQSEFRLARHDGEYRRVTARAVPVVSSDATFHEWVGTCTDVEEERRAAEHLSQAQRIQAVGGLAGGVAHEVNNMMTAVTGFGALVLRELDPEHPQRPDVEEMVKAATRASAITRQLLAFSRQQVLQPSVLELNDVVSDVTRMLDTLLGADVHLSVRLNPSAGRVRADRGQLEQVLVNLAINARDAMPAGGSLTLETADVMLDASYTARHPGVTIKPGPYAMLVLTDTGKGMDAATLSGAFEPFYTTKPVGQGTGLGLSTVYGIVKQSGGYIWLYSELGLGTSVKLYLPQIADPLGGPTLPERAARYGHETVLIVEDEDAVRVLARRVLQALGYTVLEAPNGQVALEIIRSRISPIDLVLCDVIMAEMSGHEFGRQLALENADIPVIYMSGYPGSHVIARGLLPPGAPFVEKPFTVASLGHWVRTLLDRRGMVHSDPT